MKYKLSPNEYWARTNMERAEDALKDEYYDKCRDYCRQCMKYTNKLYVELSKEISPSKFTESEAGVLEKLKESYLSSARVTRLDASKKNANRYIVATEKILDEVLALIWKYSTS